ncbi:MAG: HAMP domain-containing histidine kinase [Myxococcales bacterium]|nr:HAMP domain-containing histidine kinase [Myxococcales bacterium]
MSTPRPGLGKNPIAAFVRAKLQRRLFVWFGASILVTAAVATVTMAVVWRIGEPWWRQDYDRARRFIGGQFERVWDSPGDREALARSMAQELDLGVALRDASGTSLLVLGPACRYHSIRAPVLRGAAALGSVEICLDRQRPWAWWKHLLPLAAAVGVLWAATGLIARRLSRPLIELARVAHQIGGGNLKARLQLPPDASGEVAVVGEAVNEMAGRIEKQMADQRELLAAVSHELRTPLSRIRLLTELARDNGATAKTYDELDREVTEIDSLVGDLLANSRIDFAALSRRELDAAEVARTAIERAGLDPALLASEAPSPEVNADPTLLARALANLLDNAQRHGGGLLRLSVRSAASAVCFEAEDSGPGFPPGQEPEVFQPFRRSEGKRADGLGLGLALVRRIAEAHGGRAYAANRPGGGAKVGIELPR